MTDRLLRLSRIRAGLYIDPNSDVTIEFDGDLWILTIRGSWVTTEHTKRACVEAARREIGGWTDA